MVTKVGTIRVKTKSLKVYEKTSAGWKLSKRQFPELFLVVTLFKSNKNFKILVDKKTPEFLKGQLSPEGQEQGARIDILPTGEKLEKAFSLFSPHLRIHDQSSHDHWDVLYQNKGGTWSYVYTLEKRKLHRAQKYKKVELFEKQYSKLVKNIKCGLKDNNDNLAVPMHTLLNTYMRVGNEVYFKAHGHKGLTTLTKKDVSVKGNIVTFNYIGKGGVPIKINYHSSPDYIKRLKLLLNTKKSNEFIFPLHERDFKKAFVKYCGQEFYPHIVRSHYATTQVKNFLKSKRKITKLERDELFMSIAHSLGHKKFNKKNNEWQDHYVVTVNSYIQPSLVERVENKLVSSKK